MKLSQRLWMFFSVASVVFIADQITKWCAVTHLTTVFYSENFKEKLDQFLWFKHPESIRAVPVVPDFWHFRYVENPGAAWGFLSGANTAWRTPFFIVLSLVAMVFIVTYYFKTPKEQRLLRFSLAMVFGGAVGNFFDRIRLGYVVDFIDWHWYEKATWPTFNVADAAISVGVVLMLLDSFLHPAPKKA